MAFILSVKYIRSMTSNCTQFTLRSVLQFRQHEQLSTESTQTIEQSKKDKKP